MRESERQGGGGRTEKFSVEPAALTALAKILDELKADADAARSYATSYADVHSSGGGLMVKMADATVHLQDDLEEAFGRASEITGRAADEIIASRKEYRSLDHAAAQAVDTSYWSR